MMDGSKTDIVGFYGLTSAGRNAFVTRFTYFTNAIGAAMNELFHGSSSSRFGP